MHIKRINSNCFYLPGVSVSSEIREVKSIANASESTVSNFGESNKEPRIE